ncbi:MAG: ribulose-phosphate 3-epimerase [Chloroflexi bacterium RBG_16_48_7]|nr:MAG: ribulose-phosphate 3-epimerase [Chloroflexi bacterium RBG_16_48_7]
MKKKAVKIAPSILSADFGCLSEQIQAISEGGADYIHVDVMDGHFVPNISVGIPIVEALKKLTSVPLDVHLMIQNPSQYVREFAKAGADIITVHVETDPHLYRLIENIKAMDVKAGVALNPSTNLNTLDEVLHLLDLVLIMSVNPGFGGQKFIPSSIDKISRLRKTLDDNYPAELEVDGGVTEENTGDIVSAGADVLVAGNAIFGNSDITQAMKKLRNKANLAR